MSGFIKRFLYQLVASKLGHKRGGYHPGMSRGYGHHGHYRHHGHYKHHGHYRRRRW